MNEAERRAASEKYYQDLRKKLDERIRSDKQLQKIAEKVANKTADFNDTAKYSEIASNHLANVLQENIGEINSPLAKEYVCKELLKDQHSAINELFGSVQVSIDEQNGIHIKTQKPAFPQERVDKVAHALEDPTVSPKTTKRRAGAPVANVSKSFHDDCVKKNATFRNDAGLTCYIIREGSNCCEWCSSVAGKYKFGTQPDDIFRRHDNCDCTIIYDGQVLRGKQNADGSRSKTWEEVPNADGSYNPTVLSPEEAERLQAKNQPKILTNGVNGGTMGLRQGQDYSVAGLMFISHRDDLYQFAEKVPALPDYEDIVFHADRNSFLILNPDTGDIEKRLSPKNVADLLRNSNNYGGGDIRLLSCQSGYGGDNSLAQELANELNVKVLAPTEILAIDNTGKTFVSDNQLLIDMWGNGENVVETGQWITFKPGKEKG